ncbi:N-acetyl-gamma-glutamyl-phosphate reductase [Legionella tunisiensis]|uniref:N-acetyl-gamma-glutamyl-phosphate reductase n=1 Tax=Legionella tunisiensis TaxID=1034944 RepID=UPI0002DF3098|nr:N-acetyl-gamma-glutamyl-phosphate reductase [Legionella tunisiensis]
MSKQYKVMVVGAEGYVGQELVKLIAQHPYLELTGVFSRQNKDKLHVDLRHIPVYSLAELTVQASQTDILLLATPATISMDIAAKLAKTQIKIVDLSGAFRLAENEFTQWYGLPHQAPDLIKKAGYGLSPWLTNYDDYQLIANPGCYATCALMSLLPLIKENIIKTDNIIIDAKSGVSGAGKNPNPELMFCELMGNFFPYKIGKHQHNPEIRKAIYDHTQIAVKPRLTTQILPLVRGISMSIYAEAKVDFASDEAIAAAVKSAFQTAYQTYLLIHYEEINQDDSPFVLSLKQVVGTANTHIGYFINEGQITLFSCIDNLLKGAASQAIENINALYHLPLATGLLPMKEAA